MNGVTIVSVLKMAQKFLKDLPIVVIKMISG